MVASIERLMVALPGLETWDPLPQLCPNPDRCDALVNDHPILFDGDHLSAFGNRLVFPSFLEAMKPSSNPTQGLKARSALLRTDGLKMDH